MKKTLSAALAGLLAASTVVSAASSVDGSLDELAGQIIDRTKSDGTPTVGVSTFTHSDGTCSELSNYISEFIVDSLFNAGNGKIDIIERSQLSAIFREMDMVFDGTIAPNAAKRLGEIEGVDAIVTGSLIQFGEQVKIQARMISTQNGRLFATARSDFPNVGSVAVMMATRSREQCGFSGTAGTAPTAGVVPNGSAVQPGVAKQTAPAGLAASSRRFSSEVFQAEVSSIVYAAAKGETSFSVRIKNTSEDSIALSHVPSSLSASDGQGGNLEYKDSWSGIRVCNRDFDVRACHGNNFQYSTTIAAGKIVQLNFRMQGEKNIVEPKVSLGFELVVTPSMSDIDTYAVQTVSFYDMVPTIK